MDQPDDKAVNTAELRKEVEALRLRVAELEANGQAAQAALRLRQASALARLGTWEWEPSSDRVTWFGDMFRIYGIRPDEFTGKGSDYIQATRADYRALQQRNLEAAWKNGVTEEALRAGAGPVGDFKELCIVRPDGTECYTLGDAVCLVDADGKPLRMLGITLDITQSKKAEQALRQSEERLHLASQGAGFGIYSYDFTTGVGHWSPELRAHWGIGPDDSVKLDSDGLVPFLHPEDRAGFLAAMTSANDPTSDGIFELEYRVIWPDSSVHWLRARGRTEFTGDGETRRAWRANGAAVDITEPKLAAQALQEAVKVLRESESKWKALYSTLPVGVSILDDQGNLVEFNPMLGTILSIDAEGLRQGRYRQRTYLRADGTPMSSEEFPSVLAVKEQRTVRHVEIGVRKEDDQVVWTRVSAAPLNLPGLSCIISTTDISERKRAEASLQESEQKYRILVEESPAPISSYTPEVVLKFVNRAFADALGHPAEHIVGKRLVDLLPREEAERREVALGEVFCLGERREFELHLPRADGDHSYLTTMVPVKDGAGTVLSTICLSKDITTLKRTDEHLRRSEADLRRAQAAAHMGSWTWYPKNNRLEWSHEMYRVFGIDPTKFTGDLADVIARAIHPDDRDKVNESNLAVVREGKTVALEYRVVWPDQSVHFVWAEAGDTTRDESGNVVVLSGYAQDITERKRAELAVVESERRYRLLFDAIPESVLLIGIDRRVLAANRASARLYGYESPKQLEGFYTPLLIAEKDRERATRVQASLIQGVEHPVRQYTEVRRDGSEFVAEVMSTALRGPQQEVLGYIGITRDITALVEAQEKVRESQAYLQSVVAAAPIALWEIDCAGKILLSEGQALREWGVEAGALVGQSVFDFNKDDPAALALIRRGLAGEDFVADVQAGGRQWRNRYVPRRDARGAVCGLLGISVDITEREQAVAEKAKLEAQLLQAQKMESVGRLAGGVAHDFNNMLGVILGHAEMAMETMDPAEESLRSNLEEIRKAAERSANLTRQLLAFARKQTVAPKVLDLNETVASMLKMLRRLVGEDINLVWSPGAELYQVKVDPSQIDQILANLCVNARDAIGGVGKLSIETANSTIGDDFCATHAEVVPGEYVKLAVTDDGCGMDKVTQERIFEPFFTTKGVGKGTGLGLATVYGIVKQNNGFINVTSEPDKGTTFEICLPRHVTAKTGPAEAETLSVPVARGRETILVVEDEPGILDMTRTMLDRLGYTVLTASTAREAIRLADAHTGVIHLLMTDVVMPEMNGRDLAKNLLNSFPALKRLFMSGHTADVIARHGVLEEGVHFIQKPFSKKDLAAIVREVLERG